MIRDWPNVTMQSNDDNDDISLFCDDKDVDEGKEERS
jgi:hypothetical protein